MNKQKWIAVCVVVTMIASAASALVGLKSREEIGEPGIKVGMGELLYPGEQIDVLIGNRGRKMLGHFHADCDIKSLPDWKNIFFEVKLGDVEISFPTESQCCL